MGRPARFIPENKDGVLVEITVRAIGARALLTPGPNPQRFNEVVVGVMGRALENSPLELCGAVVLANHAHLLLVVHRQQELSRFMQHLSCNLSKEIGGRIRNWRGCFWERRYDGIVVSDEPEAQWARLKYCLGNGVKEGLCESPLEWPGVHAARALVHGEKMEGFWWNRSKEWAARNRGLDYGTYDFATKYLVGFAPLPAFRHLSPEEYRQKVAELVWEIEAEGEKKRDGNPVAGVEKILNQTPYEPPTRRTKRSPKPLFHVASKQARDDLKAELAAFLAEYRIASEALLGGNVNAVEWFPGGCYPPAFPFIGPPPPRRPPSPPTRSMTILESGAVERGEIPIVQVPVSSRASVPDPRARGQPP
ncbi:MAG: hypothetical protein GY719_11440 [bacterium]|nr:hypothetical protein [bacterium]